MAANGLGNRKDFPFIEGLRGFAALQVVLLHYCSFFLPTLGRVDGPVHLGWETAVANSPAFLPLDGYVAVNLFFIMSGFVLARSLIETRLGIAATILKRLLRLFLPAIAAILFALVLTTFLTAAREAAVALSGSIWAANLYRNPGTAASILKDVLLSSLLLGYQGASLIDRPPGAVGWASPLSNAFVPPLWTLHVEFWGSMLVLCLAQAYRRLPQWLFLMLAAGVVAGLGLERYSMFVVGFCAYVFHDRLLRPRGWAVACTGLLMIPLAAYVRSPGNIPWLIATEAILLFAAPVLCPPLRRWLVLPLPMWLGRLSFSVYLLHFPVLFTIGAAVFVKASPLGYLPACLISLIAGTAVTFVAAELFERFVDRPAIASARRIAMLMGRPGRAALPTAAGEGDLAPVPQPLSPRDFPG